MQGLVATWITNYVHILFVYMIIFLLFFPLPFLLPPSPAPHLIINYTILIVYELTLSLRPKEVPHLWMTVLLRPSRRHQGVWMTQQRHSCTGHAHQCPVKHSYPAGVVRRCRDAVRYQPRCQNNEIMNAPFSVLFENLLFQNCSKLRSCRMKVS